MRAERGRTKKLIAAFHFQFANQARWECGSCRKSGLEKRRRCGWTAETREMPARPVWARKAAVCEVCPRSYVTAESLAWVERFLVRKKLGGAEGAESLAARDAEAFLILEREWAMEEAGVREGS